VLTDQRVRPGDARDPLRQPGLAQPAAGLVLHLHIVVILGPVIPDQQQQRPCPPCLRPIRGSLRQH